MNAKTLGTVSSVTTYISTLFQTLSPRSWRLGVVCAHTAIWPRMHFSGPWTLLYYKVLTDGNLFHTVASVSGVGRSILETQKRKKNQKEEDKLEDHISEQSVPGPNLCYEEKPGEATGGCPLSCRPRGPRGGRVGRAQRQTEVCVP